MNEAQLLVQPAAPMISRLNLSEAPTGQITKYWLHLATDGLGEPIHLPVIIARGHEPGKVMGLTAAVHGNELNGMSMIQRLFRGLEVDSLKGTVVGVPVINMPALLRNQRSFIDGTDLNQIMPGKSNGSVSEVYAYRVINRIIKHFDYLVDIHTACFGRVNSHHIRADLDDPVTREMALLQNAPILVHNPPADGTLRGAAASMGIKAVTLEVGNPNSFQKDVIRSGLKGIYNLLVYLGFIPNGIERMAGESILCRRSYWIYTDAGGILSVLPNVGDFVRRGEHIANLRNVFGDLIKEYFAPEEGVVIGKSICPINQTGGRILHLGIC